VFVCGLPASGKSTVAALLAAAWDDVDPVRAVDTSQIIAASWERAHGLAPGTVLDARAHDPDAYRGILGPWGEGMARRNGWPAARIGVARGYRVIAGTRRLNELRAALGEAERRDLRSVVLWVERPGTIANDNIDRGIRRLAEAHGAVIENDGAVDGLLDRLARVTVLFGPSEAGH
jgi:hypothetical protein